jgi:hypothetical protein
MFIGVANKSCLIVLSRGVSLDALPFNARTDNTAEYGTIEESGSELNRFCKSVSDLAGSRKSPLQIVEPSEQQDAGGTLDTVRAIQSLPFLRTRFDRPLSQAVTILSDSPLAEIGQALKEYSKPAHVRSGLWNLRLALEGTDATEREWWALAQLARPFNLVLRSEALARAKISPDQMRKQEGIDLSVVTPRRRRTPAKRGKFNTKQLRVLRQIKSVKPRIDESVPQPGTEDVVSEDRSLDPPVLLLPVERRDLWIRMWVGFLGLLLVVALEPFAIVMKHIRRGGCSWRTPLA